MKKSVLFTGLIALTLANPLVASADHGGRGADDAAAVTSCAAIYAALASALSTTSASSRHKEEAQIERLADDAAGYLGGLGSSYFLEKAIEKYKEQLIKDNQEVGNYTFNQLVERFVLDLETYQEAQ